MISQNLFVVKHQQHQVLWSQHVQHESVQSTVNEMSLIISSVNGAPDLLCDSQTVAESRTRAAKLLSPLTEQRGADTLQLQLHLHCCSACQCVHHHSCK